MTPALERLLWRLDAWDRMCRACAQSNIAPIRFLNFKPAKLRLRIGESLMKSQVPVIFATDLADRLSAFMPPALPTPPRGNLELDRDSLRRVIALAQIDGDVDPLDVHAWTSTRAAETTNNNGADAFMNMYASLLARFLDEAKAAGAGAGEETAALFQLVALSSIRNVLLQHMGASDRFLGSAALLAHLCSRALTSTVEAAGDGHSARLGLLLAASCSPLSLMGAAPAVAARTGNAYRTIPAAFTRARDLVRAAMDKPGGIDVVTMRARLSAELLSTPERKRDIARAALAEGVRDLAILSTLTQGSELRDLAGSSASLATALFQPLGPERLRARIERHPRGKEEPLARLLIVVDSVAAVVAGDVAAVDRTSSVEERADIAAAGAIVLALDEIALEQAGHALATVRPVADDDADKARAAGRAYRFSLDDEPLFLLPKKVEEAFLFADMKDFTKRTVALQEESMADFLKERFYEPILRTCAHIARNPQARVSVANLLGDAVACRGDIRSLVALALSVRALLAEAARDLMGAQAAAIAYDGGGGGAALKEIELEIARTERTLAAGAPDSGALDLTRHLAELVAGREERLTKVAGAGLEAGVFVTWGREANVIEVGGPEVGAWRVIIAEQLNAAARGTARSSAMSKARAERKQSDERRFGRALADPFCVHTSADPSDTAAGTEFHNAGSALTGDALAAYQSASGGDLVFRPLSVVSSSLPPRLQAKYWLPRSREEFVLCSDKQQGKAQLLFRFSGRTLFRGLEANGPLDVWEIVLVDDGFGRDFVTALQDAERT